MPAYFESGVFTDNEPAWHGAGVVIPDEYLTKERVFELVPMLASPVVKGTIWATWETGNDADPVGVADASGENGEDRFFACIRQADGRMLGAGLGKGYEIVQNDELFTFAEQIVEEGGVWKTAGTLKDGSVVWGMLQIPEAAKIAGEDYQRNLFVTNSFDGSTGIRVGTNATRIVCANTLAIAERESKRTHSVRHTKNARVMLAEAKAALKLAYDHAEHVAALAEQLAAVKVNAKARRDLVARLVPYTPESEASDVVRRNIDDRRSDMLHVVDCSPNLDALRGTAWGAVHGINEWEQHYAYRGRTAEQKLRAVALDNDLPFTRAALAWATDLAGV